MPNGNLDTWLHQEKVGDPVDHSRPLELCERLNMAIDVASVFDYIHSHCHEPVAHCDLKPSNVFLDNDLTAHVSEFGLARIIDQESFINQVSSTGVRGTIGYAAPEYGMRRPEANHQGKGICTALEFFCWRCSLENVQRMNYVKSGFSEHVLDIADISILHSKVHDKHVSTITECLKIVFHVGISCCEESPANRMTMAQVLAELVSIRKRFFSTKRAKL